MQFPPDVRAQKVAYWNRVNSGEIFLDRWVPVAQLYRMAGCYGLADSRCAAPELPVESCEDPGSRSCNHSKSSQAVSLSMA